MNSAEIRARILLATLVLKILTPYLAKYGITFSLDDVLDLFGLVTAGWHLIAPMFQRNPVSSIPPMKPVEPAKVSP